ncbi:hypothetical protein IIA16_02150, partial [bacterium]|nr:hypothetical protein [bacterium]
KVVTALLTGEAVFAGLRRRRARRILVVGDPLGRHLTELSGGGLDLISATEDPFTQDLHGAFLCHESEPLSPALVAELAAAEPTGETAPEAAAVLARLAPGSPERGMALATLVMAMAATAAQGDAKAAPWAALTERFAEWTAHRFVARAGHHELWRRSPAAMLLCGTYHALVLWLAPTAAEDTLRRQAGRLGYPPPPKNAAVLAALNLSWQAPGAHLPAVFAVTPPGLEKSIPGEFAAFAGLRPQPCDLFGRPAVFWTP